MDKKKIPKESGEISRREFIAGTGAVLVGGVVGGVIGTQAFPKEVKPWLPDKWDKEADVVVLGQGSAGMVTAIAAHDLGAKVLILEKASEEFAGGNTVTNAGGIYLTHDPDGAFHYLKALNWGATHDDIIRVFVEGAAKQEEYYERMGFPIDPESIKVSPEFPEVGHGETALWGKAGSGEMFMEAFIGQLQDRGIEVLFETPAKKLIQDAATKEIVGVVAEHNGTKINIKAKKAVAICTGGFEFNEEMKLNYLNGPILGMGSPYNTGDGILMAQDVGADLWHMVFHAGCNPSFEFPPEYGYSTMLWMPTGPWIFVDKYGKRFMQEKMGGMERHGFPFREALLEFDPYAVEYPRIPCWVIADETTRLSGAWGLNFCGWAGIRGHKWSSDNSEEIAKGWILQENTLSALASKVGLDSTILADTVAKYNGYCEAGEDPEFSSPADKMFPLGTPPYYAMKLMPQMLNTLGGPRRNAKSQVLDTEGRPIPRLYAVGECGSVVGFIYQSSENMAECVVFGQIAGENAAKEVTQD